MHVIFVEPAFPKNQREFVRALHQAGARVTGIGESPVEALDSELKSWMHAYERVRSVVDEGALHDAVKRCQAREWVDRLETTVEAHILAVANVREKCAIPGTSVRTAFLCRDKPAMKDALRAAGIPCAQSIGTKDLAEAREFVGNVGYPVILKPRDAAGASGTFKAADAKELETAFQASGLAQGRSVAIEEFIEGHEGFYDTLTIDGKVVHDFACHYFPNVLEAMRTRWISPQIISTNRIDQGDYGEVRVMGQKVIEALGITTSATHMEWFFGPKGLKFSEIGCRPPGVRVWDLYSAGNGFDMYVEWAKAIVHGKTTTKPSRKFATGLIALRPDKDGKIVRYEGVEEMQRRFGANVFNSFFPAPGTPTQGVEAGYMANAWVHMKHPNFDELKNMMNSVGETVKVRAQG